MNSEIVKTHSNLRRNLSELDMHRLRFLQDFNSIGTRNEYKRNLGEFITYIRTEFLINELKVEREHITAFKSYLQLNRSNSSVTINKKLSVISSYFSYLQNLRIVNDNPCFYVRRFNVSNLGMTRALDRKSVEKLYTSLPSSNFHHLKIKTMVVLLIETGIRESELLSLKLSSITKDFGSYVLIFDQKGGKKHKVILNELAVAILGQYLEQLLELGPSTGEESLLFSTKSGKKIDRKNFYKLFKKIGSKYNIDNDLNPHMTRATYIRQKYEEGIDIYRVKKDVGHSSIKTTERYLG